MAQIFDSLFAKIHPLAIGAIEQTYALAKLIGKQCLRSHMKAEGDSDRIDAIVNRLCDDYKSHQYPIGRHEAKELGLKVVDASDEAEQILYELLTFYSARPVGPFAAGQIVAGQTVKTQIAWIDSVRLKFRVEQMMVLNQQGVFDAQGDAWVPY